MSEVSGMSFPRIFDGNRTNVVSGYEKAKACVDLLLRSQVRVMLMNPKLGIDLESSLFLEDVGFTRDYLWTIMSDAIKERISNVELNDVVVETAGDTVKVKVFLKYLVGQKDFSFEYEYGGGLNE